MQAELLPLRYIFPFKNKDVFQQLKSYMSLSKCVLTHGIWYMQQLGMCSLNEWLQRASMWGLSISEKSENVTKSVEFLNTTFWMLQEKVLCVLLIRTSNQSISFLYACTQMFTDIQDDLKALYTSKVIFTVTINKHVT